jgi:2-polyprenyl-3-methyl-5-hydroxy-6-metoxy-1,4-benzoquinol methylase
MRLMVNESKAFDVLVRSVHIGNWAFEFVHPRSADALIDEADFARDERLPYWAEVWNSSFALAERIATERGDGRELLEMGCGIGLASTVAARAGFRVTATDYYLPALEFAQQNAHHNGESLFATRIIDWRSLPAELTLFDVVVASDVLYERPNVALVAAAFARTLRPGGLGVLADPQRRHAATFPEECSRHGLRIVSRSVVPVLIEDKSQDIDLFEIARVRLANLDSVNAH